MSDGRLQVLNQLLHILAELIGLASGQTNGIRAMGLGEVVDVDPVIRSRAGGGLPGEELVYGGGFSRPGGACSEDVVAVVVDAHAESHGGYSPGLADDLGKVGQFCRGGKSEFRSVAGPVDFRGCEFPRGSGHSILRFVDWGRRFRPGVGPVGIYPILGAGIANGMSEGGLEPPRPIKGTSPSS